MHTRNLGDRDLFLLSFSMCTCGLNFGKIVGKYKIYPVFQAILLIVQLCEHPDGTQYYLKTFDTFKAGSATLKDNESIC